MEQLTFPENMKLFARPVRPLTVTRKEQRHMPPLAANHAFDVGINDEKSKDVPSTVKHDMYMSRRKIPLHVI